MTAAGSDPIWLAGHQTRIASPGGMGTIWAPTGVRSFVPEEMTVSCGAGTGVEELQAILADKGQYVNLPVREGRSGTVGGALSVGEGDIYRLGRGSIRDVLLQAVVVGSSGETFKAGGPTVKNVSGFDLCRLLVGSCGRIGLLADVILRTRPLPMATQWLSLEEADGSSITAILRHVRRPASLLWTGDRLYLCLEGHPEDMRDTRRNLREVLGRSVIECGEPSLLEYPYRWICSPSDIRDVLERHPGECMAEMVTGIVHHRRPRIDLVEEDSVQEIEKRILQAFDPFDRLNGGTKMWGPRHLRRLCPAP